MSCIFDDDVTFLPRLYISTMTFSPQIESAADQWNNTVHIPELTRIGFLNAVRYRTIGGNFQTFHVYEVSNIEILTSDAYSGLKRPPHDILEGISDYSVSLYRYLITARSAQTNDKRTSNAPHSRYLATVKMDVLPDYSEELISWCREEHIPALMDVTGMISAKLCRRVGYHPEFRSLDPEWILIYEMHSLEMLSLTSIGKSASPWFKFQSIRQFIDIRHSVLERIFPDD